MKEIYQQLTESSCLKGVITAIKKEVAIPTGCLFSNKTELYLNIYNIDETFSLTDNGQTIDYVENIFDFESEEVIKHFRAITNYYGIKMKNNKLTLSINSEEDFIEGYQKMIFCTDFMDTMKIFYQ